MQTFDNNTYTHKIYSHNNRVVLISMGNGSMNSAFNNYVYLYKIIVYEYNNGSHQLIGNITFEAPWTKLRYLIQVSPQLTKIYIKYRNNNLNKTYNLLYNVNFESNSIS